MQANEAITKIKLLLGLNEETVEETVVMETAEETSVEFATAKLADGTEVKVEGEFEEGKACFVETEEGDIPAPAGKHQMEDNTIITIDENGQITAIEEVEAEPVVAEDDKEEVEMEEEKEEESMEEEVVEEVSMAEEIVEMLKPYFEEIKDLKEKVQEMEGKFQAFSAAPAAKPIKKAEAFEANKMSAVDRIAKIRRNK